MAVAVAVIAKPVSLALLLLQSFAIRLGVRPDYLMNLIHADDMAGCVPNVDIELLWVRCHAAGVAVGRPLAAFLRACLKRLLRKE
jgi:hypothetical protein